MRFMIIVKATPDFESGVPPTAGHLETMAAFHEEMHRAGIVLDASGLQPTAKGFRVHDAGGARTIVDGPFPGTEDLIVGYTIIQVRSREEAVAWARRFPMPDAGPGDAHIEVRQLLGRDTSIETGPDAAPRASGT